MIWTEERVDTAILLWQGGESLTSIARGFGTTRNAVAGKLWRLKLMGKHSPPRPRPVWTGPAPITLPRLKCLEDGI